MKPAWWFLLICLLVPGCDRRGPGITDPEIPVIGYRIEGVVTDELARPVADVQVVLYYDLSPESGDSVTRAYTPADTSEFIIVRVLDASGATVRQLYAGQAPQGSDLYIVWDERDSLGNTVRSGLYSIVFTVSGQVRKSYRLIVDGNLNAVTDSLGRFEIPESDLPVDEIAPFYDEDSRFLGNYRITDQVYLLFTAPSYTSRTFHIVLAKNRVTNFSAILL